LPSKEFKLVDHVLVPKHEVVPAKEAEELMKKYGATKERMPIILRSDPIMEEIGAKKGDLIRIVRKSVTAGESIYYRIVG